MIDLVTSGEIVESFQGGLRRLLALAQDASRLEAYVRASLERPDYERSVADCDTPAWERAFAHVLMLQDLVRRLDDRTRAGRIRGSEPETMSDERRAYLKALERTELGYQHDPSWTNGGLASHGADPRPDDPAKRALKPALRRVAVYGAVVQLDGVPEVAWNYSASAFELGVSSTHDAMVARMLLGSAMGGGSYDTPAGPTDDQVHAANLQRRIRERLGRVPTHLQAVLELAYTDRRYELHLVSDYGVGLAPIVWRSQQRVAFQTPKLGPGERDKLVLADLVAEVRREWPSYTAGAKGSLKTRIRKAADQLLWTAHEYYQSAAGIEPPKPRKRKAKRPDLIAAGTKGRKRRQLVEAPGRAA